MDSSKQHLRLEARRHRARMDIRGEDPVVAADLFFKSINPSKGQVVAAYWPTGSEFDSRPLIERLLEAGIECALPMTQKDMRALRFAKWDDAMTLQKGAHNVMEPIADETTVWLEPDIIIVPLLAFDRRGYRLGQGGGHYDATLAAMRLKKKIVAVGLGYSQQACLFNLPVEAHDEKLDWVITPLGAQDFRDF
ncbi:MAG: 5-formyltetrahydrofolate cyclo-ligase [Alphaproteobacteria bacterium]